MVVEVASAELEYMQTELNAERVNRMSTLLNTDAKKVLASKEAEEAFVKDRLVAECTPLSFYDVVTRQDLCDCELIICIQPIFDVVYKEHDLLSVLKLHPRMIEPSKGSEHNFSGTNKPVAMDHLQLGTSCASLSTVFDIPSFNERGGGWHNESVVQE